MTNGLKDTRDNIFSFEGTDLQRKRKSGDNSGEATPVPISNTEVKLLSADDTWWEAAWESRTLPVFFFFCKPAASLLSESTLFHDGIGFAARMKSVKLGMPRYMDVAGFLLL